MEFFFTSGSVLLNIKKKICILAVDNLHTDILNFWGFNLINSMTLCDLVLL